MEHPCYTLALALKTNDLSDKEQVAFHKVMVTLCQGEMPSLTDTFLDDIIKQLPNSLIEEFLHNLCNAPKIRIENTSNGASFVGFTDEQDTFIYCFCSKEMCRIRH